MKTRFLSKNGWIFLLSGLFVFPACHSTYQLAEVEGGRVEMTSVYDKAPDQTAVSLLAPYKIKVDSIMNPVIGKSEMSMKAERPESLLSNLIADVLKESSSKYIGMPADIAIINIGGLRNDLFKGDITYGEVYEILPFENSLCILTMNGKLLIKLFEDIAKVKGEGISGAKLKITSEGKLTEATVNGKTIDENKLYKVATVDYLAEGNDGMEAFTESEDKICPDGATVRQLFIDYISNLTKKGKAISSRIEGRISIEN